MPIICLMVRENHKMVREMSGKSQGILWGLMAGHPELYCFKNVRIPKQHAVHEILCSRIKLPTSRFFDRTNRLIARYYSHLVAVRGRCSITYMHAGTLGFTYMEIQAAKYIFVWIKPQIPILNKSLPHGIQTWSIIKFSYLFWTMSQRYFHFTSHSQVHVWPKLPAHRAYDCHGP